MTEVMARLDIELFVDCPKCDHLIDLLNQKDTAGYDHNEEGRVLTQACPDGYWTDEHKKFSVKNVECSKCGSQFNVKGFGTNGEYKQK